MKTAPTAGLLLLFLAGTVTPAGAGILKWFWAHKEDWSAIQSTGGVKILPPEVDGGKLRLPVVYDASGTTSVTCAPTVVNSGLVVDKVKVKRSGDRIVIQVYTMPVKDTGSTEGTGKLHHADLSGIPPGEYDVYYGDAAKPDQKLGRIEIK